MCFCVNWFFGGEYYLFSVIEPHSKFDCAWTLIDTILYSRMLHHCSAPCCNVPNILLMCVEQPISQGVSFQLRHHLREDGHMELCQWMPGHRDSRQQSVIMRQTRRHHWLRMRLVLVLGHPSGFLWLYVVLHICWMILNGGKGLERNYWYYLLLWFMAMITVHKYLCLVLIWSLLLK